MTTVIIHYKIKIHNQYDGKAASTGLLVNAILLYSKSLLSIFVILIEKPKFSRYDYVLSSNDNETSRHEFLSSCCNLVANLT